MRNKEVLDNFKHGKGNLNRFRRQKKQPSNTKNKRALQMTEFKFGQSPRPDDSLGWKGSVKDGNKQSRSNIRLQKVNSYRLKSNNLERFVNQRKQQHPEIEKEMAKTFSDLKSVQRRSNQNNIHSTTNATMDLFNETLVTMKQFTPKIESPKNNFLYSLRRKKKVQQSIIIPPIG